MTPVSDSTSKAYWPNFGNPDAGPMKSTISIQGGKITRTSNPAPPLHRARICTIHDLINREDRAITELEKTMQERIEIDEKTRQLIGTVSDGLEKMNAGTRRTTRVIDEITNIVQELKVRLEAQTVKAREDTVKIEKDIAKIKEDTAKIEKDTVKIKEDAAKTIQQTAQLESVQQYLEEIQSQKLDIDSLDIFPETILEPTPNAKNWTIIRSLAYSVITEVAIAVIFGTLALLISSALAIGAIFWMAHEEERAALPNLISSERQASYPFNCGEFSSEKSTPPSLVY
jgi:hypothetical protein